LTARHARARPGSRPGNGITEPLLRLASRIDSGAAPPSGLSGSQAGRRTQNSNLAMAMRIHVINSISRLMETPS